VSLRTRFFGLQAEVDYAGSEAVMTSLFEQQAAGPVRLVARRWTLEE
jgi:general secretion pathway protein K